MISISVFCCFLCLCVTSVYTGRYVISFPINTCKPSLGEQCMEIRRCPYFADLLERSSIPRPRGVIKIIREHQCGFQGNIPKVCCTLQTTTPPPPPTTTTVTTTTTTKLAPIESRWENELRSHKNYDLLPNGVCGQIPTNSRITSGRKTAVGEFPWMALIAYNTTDGDGLEFRCGGTVISNRYILTAAHCILNSNIVGVRLGEHNLDTVEDCDSEGNYCAPQVQDFYIESFSVHPDYNPKTYFNDIALIRLVTPANFTAENVQPICLPVGEPSNNDLNGKYAIVSGWGVTENGYKSPELLKVSIPVVPISDCQRIYQRFAPITSTQICAGGHLGGDSCGGDSGGPLKYVGMVEGTPRYIQYGIVSYGPRHCGTDGQPGIYTRVTSYLHWILDNIKPSLEVI